MTLVHTTKLYIMGFFPSVNVEILPWPVLRVLKLQQAEIQESKNLEKCLLLELSVLSLCHQINLKVNQWEHVSSRVVCTLISLVKLQLINYNRTSSIHSIFFVAL